MSSARSKNAHMRDERRRARAIFNQNKQVPPSIFQSRRSVDTVAPAFKLLTRRHGHILRGLPLDLICAPEALRFLVRPLFQCSFPFTLCCEFLDVAVFDVAGQVSPVPRRVIGDVLGIDVVVYLELCGNVFLGIRFGVFEANAWVCWCGAGEE